MSDTLEEKYFYAIIRKPQEGKTFICLKNIENEKGRKEKEGDRRMSKRDICCRRRRINL